MLLGGQAYALFELLRFLRSCNGKVSDTKAVEADKDAAQDLIYNDILPLLQKLLRSFDPATVDAATGNNALHEMYSLFGLVDPHQWDYELAELLITRGVSLHQRNKKGRTPLLQAAASDFQDKVTTACGMRLLLSHGADLNAQDNDGNGVLHHIVRKGDLAVLEDLLGGGGVSHLDHFLRNSAGQTAVDLASIRLAQQADNSANSPVKRIHQLMTAQSSIWTKHVATRVAHVSGAGDARV